MYTKLTKEWRITLPETLIREIGLREGCMLECRAEGGEIRLRCAALSGGKS